VGNMTASLEKFKSSCQKWKRNIKRNNYYRNSKISFLGRTMNLLLAELILFIIGYLWFIQKTKIPMLSLFLSLTINALMTIAYVLRSRKFFLKKRTKTRRQVARDFLAEHIKQLEPDEFKWQITRVLLKLNGIENIEDKGNFLVTDFQGKRVAIGYYNDKFGEEVSPRELADFLNQAKTEGFPAAMFVATGQYSDSCRALAEKKSTTKVHLLNMDDLLDIMEKSDMFPDEKTVDALIDKEIDSKKRKLHCLRKEILTPKRIRTYLGYSILFFVLSRIFQYMRTYYAAVSIVFLLLAALSWIWGLRNPAEPADNQQLIDALTAKEN